MPKDKKENKTEDLAEKLHIWYLEATKELDPGNYNPNAQKSYQDLTEEQKFIDKYIAGKIQNLLQREYEQGVKDEIECVETSGEHFDLQKKIKDKKE